MNTPTPDQILADVDAHLDVEDAPVVEVADTTADMPPQYQPVGTVEVPDTDTPPAPPAADDAP